MNSKVISEVVYFWMFMLGVLIFGEPANAIQASVTEAKGEEGEDLLYYRISDEAVDSLPEKFFGKTLDLASLIPCMDREAPEAARVIEYSRPAFHGDPLLEDIAWLFEQEKNLLKPEPGE